MSIPIFIICKDRVTVLKQSIASYLPLGDVEIILIDNGSTYPPMLEYLRTCGYTVYRNQPLNNFADISESIATLITHWFTTTKSDSKYYIVTDPDIELENPSPALLDYYKRVLNHFLNISVVAPMLRIDDLPECFKLRDEMRLAHIEQFWKYEPVTFLESKIQLAGVDTTFGMYRRSFRFHRLNNGIRVHEPYMARHLDWYIDTDNLTEEQEYYFIHASNVSSMCNHLKRGVPVWSFSA